MYDCYQILLCNERNKSRKLTGRLKNISLSLSCVIFVYFGHISVILLLYSVPSVRLLTIVFISVFLGATENARHEIAAKSKSCCRKCEKVIYSYTVTFVILFFRVFFHTYFYCDLIFMKNKVYDIDVWYNMARCALQYFPVKQNLSVKASESFSRWLVCGCLSMTNSNSHDSFTCWWCWNTFRVFFRFSDVLGRRRHNTSTLSSASTPDIYLFWVAR